MSTFGAKAALQGYRLQALYTVSEILLSSDQDIVFQPEGKGDLDIYLKDKLIRSIQIKSHAAGLAYSNFNPSSPKSFFRRALTTFTGSESSVEVVSFGPIGLELMSLSEGSSKQGSTIKQKFIADGYSEHEFELIVKNIKWSQVDEAEVAEDVFHYLRNSMTGGDPVVAFDLLSYWMYKAAEKGARVNRSEIVEKVCSIGKYLMERKAHQEEWFTSIVPIEDKGLALGDADVLSAEFYKGISTRYDHIVAGCDVERTDTLCMVDSEFEKGRKIVIIYGASGQGKTTLVYRYLHDYIPQAWRFLIRYVDDKQHASRISLALSEHMKVVEAPVYIYIDVQPRNSNWCDLVRDLIQSDNIRIIVTIRQEDFVKSTVSEHDIGFPSFIELGFSEKEARLIFTTLLEQRRGFSYPSFEEAWSRFGKKGSLLEFVYFLTQNELLKDRLHQQALMLQEEVRIGSMSRAELKFLRICSVATAYESRIDIKSLCREISLPEPAATLRRFENEYFIRLTENKRYVESIHPIRSDILAGELCDDIFSAWSESARDALCHIPDADLESFLLYSFSRHLGDVDSIVSSVVERQFQTWVGIAGAVRALLWLGIREYVSENDSVVKGARKLLGRSWWLFLKSDVAGLLDSSDDMFNIMTEYKPEIHTALTTLRDSQTSPLNIYKNINLLLVSQTCLPNTPGSVDEWGDFAEVVFWLSKLDLFQRIGCLNLNNIEFNWALEHLPVDRLCELVYCMQILPGESTSDNLRQFIENAKEYVFEKYLILHLSCDDTKITAHYIVDYDNFTSKTDVVNAGDDRLHGETMKRINALRLLFPMFDYYGAQGYGHRLDICPWPYDPTLKTGISKQYLPLPWVAKINPTWLNIVEWDVRKDTWDDYVNEVLEFRSLLSTVFASLNSSLNKYFSRRKPYNILQDLDLSAWDKIKEFCQNTPLLPKISVDEWGINSETRKQISPDENKNYSIANVSSGVFIAKYHDYLKISSDYLTGLSFFFSYALDVVSVNSVKGRIRQKDVREKILRDLESVGTVLKENSLIVWNLKDAFENLSAYQAAFRKLFKNFYNGSEISNIECNESSAYMELFPVWYKFFSNPEIITPFAVKKSVREFQGIRNKYKEILRRSFESHFSACNSVVLVDDDVKYREKFTLIVLIDLLGPAGCESMSSVGDIFYDCFKDVGVKSLEWYALNYFWNNIVIIFHIDRCVAHETMLCIPFVMLVGEKYDFDSNAMHRVVDLPVEIKFHCRLRLIKSPAIEWISMLQKQIMELYCMISHIFDVESISEILSENEKLRLLCYVKAKEVALSHCIDKLSVLVSQGDIVRYVEDRSNQNLVIIISNIFKEVEKLFSQSNEDSLGVVTKDNYKAWLAGLATITKVMSSSSVLVGIEESMLH